MRTLRHETGFSLIEIMVALLLASLILSGVVVLFQQSKGSSLQDEQIARMQENGRFALRLVSREISMAGYFGGMLSLTPTAAPWSNAQLNTTDVNGKIDCDTAQNSDWGATLVHESDANDMITDASTIKEGSIQYFDKGKYPHGSTVDYACIDVTKIQANTDIVAIKRVGDTANFEYDDVLNNDISTLKSVVKGSVYFKTNGSGGGLYIAGSSSDSGETTTGISNKLSNVRAYMPEIFYIRRFSATDGDGIPTLVRETLVGTVMQEQPMVDGIQDMQIEWGVDGTDAGNEPDYYVANPTAQELGDAVTARVYLLVRSVQPVTGYKNDKTYNLGSTVAGPFNDAYYRRVYTATVSMRNAPKIKFLII